MTAPHGDLLHDPGALTRADAAGLLPAVATAGAQVRAVADQLRGLTDVERPRALVVAGSRVGAETALLAALLGPSSVAPVVAVREIPRWLGALDVVVVLADRTHDPVAAAAADIAARRGARVLVRAAETPAGTPMPPMMAVSESLAAPARIALLVGVALACGLLRAGDPDRWADALDDVALRCHPSAGSFANPGVAFAEHLSAGPALLVGLDPVGDALAALVGTALVEVAGVPATVLGQAAAISSPALLRRAAQPRDLFADPDDEDLLAVRPAAVLLSGLPLDGSGRTDRHPLVSALPAALVLEPGSGSGPTDPSSPPGPARDGSTVPGEPLDQVASALTTLLRATFGAVYLGLVAGQQTPLDHPDGLGRAGTALGAVRGDRRWEPAPASRDLAGDDDLLPGDPRSDPYRDPRSDPFRR